MGKRDDRHFGVVSEEQETLRQTVFTVILPQPMSGDKVQIDMCLVLPMTIPDLHTSVDFLSLMYGDTIDEALWEKAIADSSHDADIIELRAAYLELQAFYMVYDIRHRTQSNMYGLFGVCGEDAVCHEELQLYIQNMSNDELTVFLKKAKLSD